MTDTDKCVEAVARAIWDTQDGPEHGPRNEEKEYWKVAARAAILETLRLITREPEVGVGDLQAKIRALITVIADED